MKQNFNPAERTLIIAGITALALLPVFLYMLFIGNAPTLDASKTITMLSNQKSGALLVDLRSPEEFKKMHFDKSVNSQYSDIMRISSLNGFPPELRDRQLIFVCDGGITSAFAANHINRLTKGKIAFSVDSGFQHLVMSASEKNDPVIQTECGVFRQETRSISLLEQLAIMMSGFFIKPLYMLLSAVLIVWLKKNQSHDIDMIRIALFFFLAGEGFCAVNYLFFRDEGLLVEYLHMFGMVMCFSFSAYGFFQFIDKRVLKYGVADKKCALLNLCADCSKYSEVPCKIRKIYLSVLPMIAIVSALPFVSAIHAQSYNASIFGVAYNYHHQPVLQLYENYTAPSIAIFFFLLSFLKLMGTPGSIGRFAKVFFAAGIGFSGFGIMRMFFVSSFIETLWWFDIWEEITELMFVTGVALFLWFFRVRIFAGDIRQAQ